MSIGKNSILRVQNAEKSGAAQIVTQAPDMENSTVTEAPKKTAPKKSAPKKNAPAKTATKKSNAKKASAPKEETKANTLTYCQIGEEMPVYLL